MSSLVLSYHALSEAPVKVADRAFEVYSPGMLSPAPVKKSRKNITAPNVTAAGAALQAAGRAVAAKSSRRVVGSDDDEDEDSDGGDAMEVVKRTPKPVRQRAVKSYVQEDSEPESNAESSEYESD
jgi:hypothetical protein